MIPLHSLCRWRQAIDALLRLRDSNAKAVLARGETATSIPRRGFLLKSSSSRSVRDLQEQLKRDRNRGGDSSLTDQDKISIYYSRFDFLADMKALEVTRQDLDYLSNAAESGSEVRDLSTMPTLTPKEDYKQVEGRKKSTKVDNGRNADTELASDDVTFISSPVRHQQLYPSMHTDFTSVFNDTHGNYLSSPEKTIEANKKPLDEHTLRTQCGVGVGIMKDTECQKMNIEEKDEVNTNKDLTPREWMKINRGQSNRSEIADDDSENLELNALMRSTFLDGSRPTVIPERKDNNGNVSEASTSSCRGRVIVTRKGREEQSRHGSDDSGQNFRKSLSRFEKSLGSMTSKRKKRLSTAMTNAEEKNATKIKENGVTPVAVEHGLLRGSVEQNPATYEDNEMYIIESPSTILVAYYNSDQCKIQYFQVKLTSHLVSFTKVALAKGTAPNDDGRNGRRFLAEKKFSSRTMSLSGD